MDSDEEYDKEEFYSGGGFVYPSPLHLGSLTIRTSHDYMLSITLVHQQLSQLGFDEGDIELFDEDLGPDGDIEGAESSIEWIRESQSTLDLAGLGEQLSSSMIPTLPAETEGIDVEESRALITSLLEDFSIDAIASPETRDGIKIEPYEANCPTSLQLRSGLSPPRPPSLWQAQYTPIALRVCRMQSQQNYRLRRNMKWGDIISEKIPIEFTFPTEAHFSSFSERKCSDAALSMSVPSTLSGLTESMDLEEKSNTRPRGGIVVIEMSDGSHQNVGSHSYRLKSDIFLPLDFSSADQALAELFSAIAGEGIGCATGSHDLHQMTSAVLAAALDEGGGVENLEVEYERDDIVGDCVAFGKDRLQIDITTTSGIWKKPLKKRRMMALSKYDLGAIFTLLNPNRVSESFALAIMNCLAVEHTAYYGLPDYGNLDKDLDIHYRISDRLHMLSQSTVKDLSLMSYEALVAESVAVALDMDPFPKGEEYKGKAKRLRSGIMNLGHHDRIAVPPYPTTEVIGFSHKPQEIDVETLHLYVPSITNAIAFNSADFKTDDQASFLESFPTSGLFPYDEVWELCQLYQNKMMKSYGLTHKGPLHKPESTQDKLSLWDMASNLYASSAVAQYAEIRADLVKYIDSNPMPGRNVWKMCRLYKEKVLAWYSCKDAPNDARGYRIDWFAVSAFEVIGSRKISTTDDAPLWLWPRQRVRSQEMDLAAMTPRRLKLVLFSLLDKAKATGATVNDILLAWQKLALTATSSTWASGANYITCRHLSASFCSPSSPFDSMVSKFKTIKTMAGMVYLSSVVNAIDHWDKRDTYHTKCAFLGLPRAFYQLEAYWQVWVPDELADANKHMVDCALALYDEYDLLNATFNDRYADALSQYELLSRSDISFDDIRQSIAASCNLQTGGKLGWSIFGSLASAHALSLEGDVAKFDREFSRGTKARRIVDHLTVRHSARISPDQKLETGTVAEMILANGVDDYLSTLMPTFRFFYVKEPLYINHPKNGELKDREISIADPDSRIMLNNAELINGSYGKRTSVDMLKRPDKDAHFYKISAEAILSGGAIQASDASRFSAMMSNVATGITNLALACQGGSAHLMSSAATYRRLASRRMVLSSEMLVEVDKRLSQDRSPKDLTRLQEFRDWLTSMPEIGDDGTHTIRAYRTAVHTGQGMSHHGTSLAHGGALLVSLKAASQAKIIVSGKRAIVSGIPLVTSDDSTIIAGLTEGSNSEQLSRHEAQRACQLFLKVQRETRKVALRSVSVIANLPKEKVSGICGEFNSQDNGIGVACPILGFREMICQLTRPSAPSLIGDYLNGHAYGQTVALNAQGLNVGIMANKIYIDSIEARWKLRDEERNCILACPLIPESLISGADLETILKTPVSMLPAVIRRKMMQASFDIHQESDVIDPHAQDSAFAPLSHIRISMKKQHVKALQVLKDRIAYLKTENLPNQALMMEQSLGATMSSAKHRNIGRVGQRIRNRMITPPDCLGHSFQKGPILESTLTWFSYLASYIPSLEASPEICALALQHGGYVTCIKPTYLRYPQPATKRRSRRPDIKKPVYVIEPYGKTPFGRHAISRGNAKLIKEFTSVERANIQRALVGLSYRRIPEHIQYGGKFTSSWLHQTSCILMAHDEAGGGIIKVSEQTMWGKMMQDEIEFLRDTELNNPDIPILAFNYGHGGKAHFHGVFRGHPYSCSINYDKDINSRFSVYPGTAFGGKEVLLADQGWSYVQEWYGTGPSFEEIDRFQHDPSDEFDNTDIETLASEMEKEGRMSVPLLATVIPHEGKKVLVMSAAKMQRKVNPLLRPYERSKMVGNLATGGYWYSALKGVQFRAYIKGHYGICCTWTGPVLGWRSARVTAPGYGWEPPEGGLIKSLTMVGGIDREEDIAQLNPVEFAQAHVYVDKTGMHMVDEVHNLSLTAQLKSLIMKINGGKLLFNDDGTKAQLIDTALPPLQDTSSKLPVDDCISELKTLIYGAEDIYSILF